MQFLCPLLSSSLSPLHFFPGSLENQNTNVSNFLMQYCLTFSFPYLSFSWFLTFFSARMYSPLPEKKKKKKLFLNRNSGTIFHIIILSKFW